MGTWQLDVNDRSALSALKKGLELGMRFIDTAEIYGTEFLVEKAIKGENDIFIATKVWPNNFKYDDVIGACNRSIARLGVKSIDLYQLHWPNYTVPIEETMSAMEQLQKDGKIRHIGVSNFSVKELEEARACLKNGDIASNQVEYSIIMREPEKDGMLDYCKKEKITLIAYMPFGHGSFFRGSNAPLLNMLEDIGRNHGKSAAQVALNWLISKEQVVAIPKASSPMHVIDNLGALGFKLSKEEVNSMEKMSEKFQKSPLAGGHLGRLLKHTKFWHGFAAKKLGKPRAKKHK